MVMGVIMRTIVKCCIFLKECPGSQGAHLEVNLPEEVVIQGGWSFEGPLIYKSASLGGVHLIS